MTKKVAIRIDLEDSEAEKFLKLKRHLGLRTNSETLRFLIERAARVEGVV